jgi:thiol-disulfide isomerase/thioredoxin
MSDTSIDRLVRGYYESREPQADRLADLEAALTAGGSRSHAPRWRTIALVAACCALFALGGALLTLSLDRDAATARPAADVIALEFYAEWCIPSQVVTARVAELETNAEDGILFVKLDLTDERRREQSRLLASSLGCGRVWDAHNGVTGKLMLVDGHTKRVLSTLGQEDDTERMRIILTQALALTSP